MLRILFVAALGLLAAGCNVTVRTSHHYGAAPYQVHGYGGGYGGGYGRRPSPQAYYAPRGALYNKVNPVAVAYRSQSPDYPGDGELLPSQGSRYTQSQKRPPTQEYLHEHVPELRKMFENRAIDARCKLYARGFDPSEWPPECNRYRRPREE